MWDTDAEGTVVNIFLPNNANKISEMKKTERTYYELHGIRDGFYFIQMHRITSILEYHHTDYLIPTALGYLERAGTMKEFEKDIVFYYARSGKTEFINMSASKVLHDYIFAVTEESVLTEDRDMDNMVGNTGKRVRDFLGAIYDGCCTVDSLRQREVRSHE
jgi:hypothetical protein